MSLNIANDRLVRAIGFNLGLRGDLAMTTVAARSFKEQFPKSHLTLGVNKNFKDLLPLFYDHPYYDSFHVYESYDDWPNQNDKEYLMASKYDIVFHGMPKHTDDWWILRHQYAEAAKMVGLPIPDNINPILTKWFNVVDYSDTIAISPFGGNGSINGKMMSFELAQSIVTWLVKSGWKVIHLGAPNEPSIEGSFRVNCSYFDSVKIMLGCKALIHCDTGMGHFAGAYNHKSIGLYAYEYFSKNFIKNIQPLHSNFTAINRKNMFDHNIDLLESDFKTILNN